MRLPSGVGTCLHTSPQTPPSTEQTANQRQVLSLTAWVSVLLLEDKLGVAGQVTELFCATIFTSKNRDNNKMCLRTSLEVQWIGLHTSTAGVRELRPCRLHGVSKQRAKPTKSKTNKQKSHNRMCLIGLLGRLSETANTEMRWAQRHSQRKRKASTRVSCYRRDLKAGQWYLYKGWETEVICF